MSSYERALKAINLEPTDRIPGCEFLSNPDFETQLTGIDAYQHPQKACLKTLKLLDIDAIDMIPLTDEPSKTQFNKGESSKLNERGKKVVRWGAGRTWSWDHGYMFRSIDDVLNFDPVFFFLETRKQKAIFEDMDPIQRYFHLSLEEMSKEFNGYQSKMQKLADDTALVGGFYYRTLFMWPLMLFGWEKFAELAYCYEKEFGRIWNSFAQISIKVMKAYSMTDIEFIFSHDDICFAQGPTFNPQWYRKNLYPYYEKIWAPLKEKRIKIIFLCDGNLDEVIDDVIAAGADGFLAEPCTDSEKFARKYKNKAILMGNIDSRILLFGGKDDIKKEVERCTRFGKECPGYFYSVSNHLGWNIPPDNIRYYFECCREMGKRG